MYKIKEILRAYNFQRTFIKIFFHIFFLNFVFVFAILSFLCLAALWLPAGKRLASGLSCM